MTSDTPSIIPVKPPPELHTDPETGREFLRWMDGTERWQDTHRFKRGPYNAPVRLDPSGMAKRGAQVKREQGIIAQLRGLAGATAELPEDADLEQIAKGALTTIEALTRHLAQTFMQSKNIRGMAETYNKLLAPFVGDEEGGGERGNLVAMGEVNEFLSILADMAREINANKHEPHDSADIDGQ